MLKFYLILPGGIMTNITTQTQQKEKKMTLKKRFKLLVLLRNLLLLLAGESNIQAITKK